MDIVDLIIISNLFYFELLLKILPIGLLKWPLYKVMNQLNENR